MIDHASPTETTAAPKPARRWLRWALPVVTLVAGVAIGTALGATAASSDPTRSAEYLALNQELQDSEGLVDIATGRATGAEASASQAADDASARNAEAAAREAAVAAVEAQVAANSVGEGTWTVGVDVEPGTYRTTVAAPGDCYWAIHVSGSNGADIVENDIPLGGFPTVTLALGQDFTNHRCGTFVKQ